MTSVRAGDLSQSDITTHPNVADANRWLGNIYVYCHCQNSAQRSIEVDRCRHFFDSHPFHYTNRCAAQLACTVRLAGFNMNTPRIPVEEGEKGVIFPGLRALFHC